MNVTADLLRSLGTNRQAFEARCDMIAALVQRNDHAALEAICRIYDRQTADEKQVNHTKHDNGIGFQQCDAKFGGFIARLHRSGRKPFADRMVRVRRMAVKYRTQLAVLSFIKDMKRAMPAGSKTPAMLEAAISQGLEVKVVAAQPTAQGDLFGYPKPEVCPHCRATKCPDGCCCAC